MPGECAANEPSILQGSSLLEEHIVNSLKQRVYQYMAASKQNCCPSRHTECHPLLLPSGTICHTSVLLSFLDSMDTIWEFQRLVVMQQPVITCWIGLV